MQIVIDKEPLITLFTVGFYAICGGDYSDVKNTVIELLNKVGYTPLPKGHGRLIDADRLTRAEIIPLWYHLPNGDIACPKIDIDHAPTIIDADKESN